jgi:uncharacterized repeat protein (TIGR01451 family)
MRARRSLLLFGVAISAAGLVLAAVRDAPLDLRWQHVVAVGALAALGALWSVRARLRTTVSEASPPDPEVPLSVTVPGTEIDRTLRGFAGPRSGTIRDRRLVRERIEEAVVDALSRVKDIPVAAARERIAAGAWTDDTDAAAFLDDSHHRRERSRREQLRNAIDPESRFQRRARHAVQAAAAVAGLGERQLDSAAAPSAATPERGDPPDDGDAPTERWRGVGALAYAAIGAGVIARRPAVLLAAAVGLGFVGYARMGEPRTPTVAVERELSDDHPDPGEEVQVQVTVENTGERTLPDLRVVDNVPDALTVVDGSPRVGAGLRPGKAATFTYTVVARGGTHEFERATVISRDFSGGTESLRGISAPTTLVCRPTLHDSDPVGLRQLGVGYAGRVETATGGEGTEFYATREYRRGDPTGRIDWGRLARTGDLATVEFRKENVATVMVVVDTREEAYLAPKSSASHAVDRSVAAGARSLASLLSGGNRVGLTAVSPHECWLSPGVGEDHRARARELLAGSPAFSPEPPDSDVSPVQWLRRLRRRLPADAQVVFVSPCCDSAAAVVARWLDGYGHPVTVVSPDPTDEQTVGQLLERVERRGRLASLREQGVQVVDWGWDEPLEVALSRRPG